MPKVCTEPVSSARAWVSPWEFSHDVLAAFLVAQLAFADGGDLPAIELVADLDLFVAAIRQPHERAAIGRLP